MRFKLDENLPLQIKRLFRNPATTRRRYWTKVWEGQRILITPDTDFADIRTYPPGNHPGIVVLRLGSQSRHNILQVGARLIGTLTESFSKGQLWIVEESRVRIRE